MEIKDTISHFPVRFKRFTFESKCMFCASYSSRLLCEKLSGAQGDFSLPHPWELACFTMLAMLDGEYGSKKLSKGDAYQLLQFIRENFVEPGGDILRVFAHDIAMIQIPFQRNLWLNLERYQYLFCFKNERLDMQTEFASRIGVSPESVFEFLLLIVSAVRQNQSILGMIRYLCVDLGGRLSKECCRLFETLSYERSEYSRLQRDRIKNASRLAPDRGFFVSPNLLEERPLIRIAGRYYLPNLHLAVTALTSRMLNRLTNHNQALRRAIGKEAFESYVRDILKKGSVYDFVSGEIRYKLGHTESLSPDVIVSKGGQILFIDCKMSEPSLNLRIYEAGNDEGLILRYAEYIQKLLKQIDNRDAYIQRDFKDDSVFGLVVVMEDSYAMRGKIFAKLETMLPSVGQVRWRWIRSHVHIVGVCEIERFAANRWDSRWDDYSIPCDKEWKPVFDARDHLLQKRNPFGHLLISPQNRLHK